MKEGKINWFSFFVNKRWLVILFLVALIFILSGIGFKFIQGNLKSKADTASINTKIQSLSSLKSDEKSSEQTTVKVSSEYSDLEIKKALAGDKSVRSQQIVESIRIQADSLVKQPLKKTKSQSRSSTKKEEEFIGDLIIDVRNSQDQSLFSPQTLNQAQSLNFIAPATNLAPADNFDFDASVPDALRQSYIDAYSKVEAIYGARSDNRKIIVFFDASLTRGWYMPVLSEIHSDYRFVNDKQLVVHELIHAFHGNFCVTPYWEEGMAQTISYYIMRNYYGAIYDDFPQSYKYEIVNSPFDPFSDGPWESVRPYTIGQSVFDKILLADQTFFANFNQLLYKQEFAYNYPELIAMASLAIPKIENQPTVEWFGKQYAFIDSNWDYELDYYFPFAANVYHYGYNSSPEWEFSGGIPLTTTSLNVKAFDTSGSLVLECNRNFIDSVSYANIPFSTCQTPFNPGRFQGMLKFIIIVNGDAGKTFTEYGILDSSGLEDSITGIEQLNSSVQNARLTNLDTNWQTTVPVQNSFFQFIGTEVKKVGRFKIDLINSSGSTVKTKYFNKFSSNYKTKIIDLPNDCSLISWKTKGLSGGIDLDVFVNKVCLDIIYFNNIPIERGITNNYKKEWRYLAGPQAYNLAMTFSNGLGNNGFKQETVMTLAPFIITKQENIGAPSQKNFRRRITFNYPLDTVALANSWTVFRDQINDNISFQAKAEKVSDLVYDFIPISQNMLDNHLYYLGLYNCKSITGGPLQYEMDSLIFVTPGSDTAAVASVDKTTINPGGDLTFTVTFTNPTPGPATNVIISNPIPAETSFVSATAGGTLVGSSIKWPSQTLATNETFTVQFTVKIN